MASTSANTNDRRTVFGWCMYDWACSAYSTTVVAGLLPAYFAEGVVGPAGVRVAGVHVSATALWAFAVAASALITFVFAPVLGAAADFSAAKKRLLLAFAFGGSLFSILLGFCRNGDVAATLILFVLAQIGFIAANLFYDAFLPQIASPDRIDRISARGYAYGYVGGGIQFGLTLALIAKHDALGLSQATAARLGLAMAALWWAGFTLVTAVCVRETAPAGTLPTGTHGFDRLIAYARIGVSRTLATTRRVRRFPHLLLFLLAFMLYNDGIQTVINMATIYGKDELKLATTDLMITLLLIQGVAMAGAVVFARIAEAFGTKRTVMLTLLLWSGVTVYAYFIRSKTEFMVLGIIVGLVLGGSQALSRSLYGSMIPAEASAEFFGFYAVFEKFSSIWGPLVFALINMLTGSSRLSIVSLAAFFIVGMVLLQCVDEDKARRAQTEWKAHGEDPSATSA